MSSEEIREIRMYALNHVLGYGEDYMSTNKGITDALVEAQKLADWVMNGPQVAKMGGPQIARPLTKKD